MTQSQYLENQKNILDKFSPEFIEKYKYCPVTNAVLNTLFRDGDKIKIIEQVLTLFEDANKELNEIQVDCIMRTGKPYKMLNDKE